MPVAGQRGAVARCLLIRVLTICHVPTFYNTKLSVACWRLAGLIDRQPQRLGCSPSPLKKNSIGWKRQEVIWRCWCFKSSIQTVFRRQKCLCYQVTYYMCLMEHITRGFLIIRCSPSCLLSECFRPSPLPFWHSLSLRISWGHKHLSRDSWLSFFCSAGRSSISVFQNMLLFSLSHIFLLTTSCAFLTPTATLPLQRQMLCTDCMMCCVVLTAPWSGQAKATFIIVVVYSFIKITIFQVPKCSKNIRPRVVNFWALQQHAF